MSLDKARADLANFEQAITKLRAKLQEVEDQVKKVRIYIEMAEVYNGHVSSPAASSAETDHLSYTKRPRSRDGIVETARKAVADILRERKAPVPTRELLSLLTDKKIEISGSQPNSNLSGMLSKSPVFVNGKGGWHLAEWVESNINKTTTKNDIKQQDMYSEPVTNDH